MSHVLSIQSHVVYGYVGSRASVFPLQRLGHDVSVIDTAQFSNHTAYDSWTGCILAANHIRDLIEGMVQLDTLKSVDAVLSSYMGDPSIGHAVADCLPRCRPDVWYLCDPVMGDYDRGIFVHPELPALFRDILIPHADIITPNHFEAELLTDQKIITLEDAINACWQLNPNRLKHVVIKSLHTVTTPPGFLDILLHTPQGCYLITTPEINFPKSPTGMGDLFSGILLGNLLSNRSSERALSATVSGLYGILATTLAMQKRELQIIKAQEEIINPSHYFTCRQISA